MYFVINGIVWDVYFVSPYSSYLRRSNGSYTIGMTDGLTNEIFIDDNLDEHMYERVLCHELVHAMSFSYNLYLDIDTEEYICSYVEVYGRDTIQLLDYLLSKYY